jgi:hypothetical protein
VTEEHDRRITNHYILHFPAHEPRESDPHYAAFNAYHRHHSKTSVCYVGRRVGFDQCADAKGKSMKDQPGHPGLELHHKVIEFSLVNGVDLAAISLDFPDLDNAEELAAWCESEPNFMWLCAKHHRGAGGIHHAAYADFAGELYVRDLIGPFESS